MILQRQVDELDELKAGHYAEIVEHEEEVWDVVQGKVCAVQLHLLYGKANMSAEDVLSGSLYLGRL